MDVLGKLFGTAARVRLLRLFLFNPRDSLTLGDAAERSRSLPRVARKEIVLFEKIGLVRPRKGGKGKMKGTRWSLAEGFTHREALQQLLLNTPVQPKEVVRRVRRVGAVKLIIISGIFLGDFDGNIDLLIVGDRVNQGRLHAAIKALETELGKEMRYALLKTEDFRYRLGLYDKLMRDVLDYPHAVILDRLHIALT